MKHLILFFLFSGSLYSFSQEQSGHLLDTKTDAIIQLPGGSYIWPAPKPDTLRAICLVTLFPNGPAHARMGYVVIEHGKRPVYLDCRKRALKLPQVGWGYIEVNPNNKN